MKLVFNNKKTIIIILTAAVGLSLVVFLIIYTPKYIQQMKEYVKESQKNKEKELFLLARKAEESRFKGDWKQALEGYKKLAEETKDSGQKLEAEFIQANIYAHQLKDNTKAQNIYIDIIKNRGNYKDNPKRAVDALMEMGLMYWNEKNYKESAKMYKIAIEEYPDKIDYSQVTWNLGACYQMLGKREEALKMIEESKKRKEGG